MASQACGPDEERHASFPSAIVEDHHRNSCGNKRGWSRDPLEAPHVGRNVTAQLCLGALPQLRGRFFWGS